MITDSAATAKIPPTSSSRKIVFVKIANEASAPPSAIEPVSPMNTSAGQALYQRNPIAPPISAAATIARSSGVSNRRPGRPERIHDITIIQAQRKSGTIPVPAASPSTPTARLQPAAAPAQTQE